MSFNFIAEPWICSVGQCNCTCCDLGNGTRNEFSALVLELSWHRLNFGCSDIFHGLLEAMSKSSIGVPRMAFGTGGPSSHSGDLL